MVNTEKFRGRLSNGTKEFIFVGTFFFTWDLRLIKNKQVHYSFKTFGEYKNIYLILIHAITKGYVFPVLYLGVNNNMGDNVKSLTLPQNPVVFFFYLAILSVQKLCQTIQIRLKSSSRHFCFAHFLGQAMCKPFLTFGMPRVLVVCLEPPTQKH